MKLPGDGMPPVPAKTAARIQHWEFVEMLELLPEFWAEDKEGKASGKGTASQVRGRKRIQDIRVWAQSFVKYVSMLSGKHPESVLELKALHNHHDLVGYSSDYEGKAWADVAYGRQVRHVASTGHKMWSKINPSIYSLCFTGKAKRVTHCDFCFSSAHRTEGGGVSSGGLLHRYTR